MPISTTSLDDTWEEKKDSNRRWRLDEAEGLIPARPAEEAVGCLFAQQCVSMEASAFWQDKAANRQPRSRKIVEVEVTVGP